MADMTPEPIPAAPPADVGDVVKALRDWPNGASNATITLRLDAADLIENLAARLAAMEAERDAVIDRAEKAEAKVVDALERAALIADPPQPRNGKEGLWVQRRRKIAAAIRALKGGDA